MEKRFLKFICFITLVLSPSVNCNAQFWGGFLQGVNQGLQNIARQQQIQRQQEEQRRKQEAQREKERRENEVHEEKNTESNGFEWIKTRKGITNRVYGAKDKNGRELIPLSRNYDLIYFDVEEKGFGYFTVRKNGKQGACDVTGKEIIPCIYESVFYGSSGSGMCFKYKGSDGKYHELDVALDENGKGCKPDPERFLSKERKIADDGFVWYEVRNGKSSDNYNKYGARTIDNKVIIPESFFYIKYLDGYFIAEKYGIDEFDNLYDINGTCVVSQNRQYKIIEVHKNEGWAKVSRQSPKGKLVGAIDLRTANEIVPLRADCSIRLNPQSKRFETKGKQQKVWAKTTYTLDKNGTPTNSSSHLASQTRNSSSSTSQSNGSSQQQTIVVEHHRDPVPVQEWQQCFACYGSGQCPYVKCGGSGWYYVGDNVTTCSRCHGNGKCTICAGKGGHYITVYR